MASLGQRAKLSIMDRYLIMSLFPGLQAGDFRVASLPTPEYNCIAWAAGETEVWWEPDINNQYYWPDGVPRNFSLDSFTKAFESIGYVICETHIYEEGLEKIAIYVDSANVPTHASRQLGQGLWTSKLGPSDDIEHSFDGLSGLEYGSITSVMKRPK